MDDFADRVRTAHGDVVQVDAVAFEEAPELERRWLEPHLAAADCTVALAMLDGRPVGTGFVLVSRGRGGACAYVAGIAVLPDARGWGAGSRIMSWLLDRGFGAGADFAHLHPDTDATARVYARLGFRETEGLDVYVDL